MIGTVLKLNNKIRRFGSDRSIYERQGHLSVIVGFAFINGHTVKIRRADLAFVLFWVCQKADRGDDDCRNRNQNHPERGLFVIHHALDSRLDAYFTER